MTDYRTIRTDIAIIGSGGAGLMCALHAGKVDPELDITVVSKGLIGRSGCTRMVQGGFNAVLNPLDSLDLHFRDTLEGGKYLNEQDLALKLVEEAPGAIRELEEEVGCRFDRGDDGAIHQKAFGGQNFDRTVHKGDLTGVEIMGRLLERMSDLAPRGLGDVRAVDLLINEDGVSGVTLLDVMTGEFSVLRAKVVVVATGGSATMYKIAAPAREKTGDGVAMCYRAGLELRDMEMLQFHPTGILAGESSLTGAVLEEGLRGAGAYLYNAEGERYMSRYDPVKMERSTRDVVARASYQEIMAGRGTPAGGVFIDISHIGAENVERMFPGMVARSRYIGGDLARRPMEISPTSHYHMGGVIADVDCKTAIEGLLVAGEDAGGLHGANRLGGNGVAESIIYGGRAGRTAAELAVSRTDQVPHKDQVENSKNRAFAPLRREQGEDPMRLTDELKQTMWEGCGLVRNEERLLSAGRKIKEISERLGEVSAPGGVAANRAWQEALDLENQLTVARTMIESALARKESRGSHYRDDYPDRDDVDYLHYIIACRDENEELELSTRPVNLKYLSPSDTASVTQASELEPEEVRE